MVQLEAGTLPEGALPRPVEASRAPRHSTTRAMRSRSARSRPTPRCCAATRRCRREFPLLCRAAAETGGVATQNRGTIGGNIANASPAADTPPALLVYDAELELVSAAARGACLRPVPRGYKQMDLAPTSSSRASICRAAARWRQDLPQGRHAPRAGHLQGLPRRGVRHHCRWPIDDVRIALGSVAPTVVRARAAEAALRGQD